MSCTGISHSMSPRQLHNNRLQRTALRARSRPSVPSYSVFASRRDPAIKREVPVQTNSRDRGPEAQPQSSRMSIQGIHLTGFARR